MGRKKLFYTMENLALGLELMVVGMASVFVILIIVILLGRLMVTLTNRIPAERQSAKPAAGDVDGGTRSIIEAAVKELTGGKGTVKEIVKL